MSNRARKTWAAIALSIPCLCGGPLAARAAELTPGNLLVTVSMAYDSTIREYTPTGSLVQSTVVPYPVTPRPSSEVVRDIVMTPNGCVAIFNGSTDPYLTRWTPGPDAWTHETYEGWSTGGNISYGGIAAWQDYVFVTDTATYGEPADVAAGIVRFNTAAGTATRYWENFDFVDVTLGWNGLLYALRPGGSSVWVFDPATMNGQSGFTLYAACSGLAVDANGVVFGASSDGSLYRFSQTGVLLDTLAVNVGGFTDVDIAADGSLVAGSRFGWVVVSDTDFGSLSTFRATQNLPVFVGFTTPVPEPGVAAALLLGLALTVRRR